MDVCLDIRSTVGMPTDGAIPWSEVMEASYVGFHVGKCFAVENHAVVQADSASETECWWRGVERSNEVGVCSHISEGNQY